MLLRYQVRRFLRCEGFNVAGGAPFIRWTYVQIYALHYAVRAQLFSRTLFPYFGVWAILETKYQRNSAQGDIEVVICHSRFVSAPDFDVIYMFSFALHTFLVMLLLWASFPFGSCVRILHTYHCLSSATFVRRTNIPPFHYLLPPRVPIHPLIGT